MKNLILIAAIGKNNELGFNNNLIWHIKEDMKFFRNTTTGYPIVMGRKTYLSLPKLLPNRTHIVLTRSDISLPSEVITFSSIEDFLNYAKNIDTDFYVIGGGTIYKEFLTIATKMILTEIDATYPKADAFFPKIDTTLWSSKVIGEYQNQEIKYLRKVYKRKDI
ncbi:MAG TPA: dihydrofolate reductase [Firmicutes bacterium]|nr:dihydrofolate reductase [Bacillota bacterium]